MVGPSDSLESINTNEVPNGAMVFVVSNHNAYYLDRLSGAAPSGDDIVAPVAGPGRFIRYPSGSSELDTRVINTTSPLRIDGGASANLSADRTLSVLGVTDLNSGVVPSVGAVGQALISTGVGAAWGTNFGAQNLVTTGAISLGSSPATSGPVRLAQGGTINWLSTNSITNLNWLGVGFVSANSMHLGSTGGFHARTDGTVWRWYNAGTVVASFEPGTGGIVGDYLFCVSTYTTSIPFRASAGGHTFMAVNATDANTYNLALLGGAAIDWRTASRALWVSPATVAPNQAPVTGTFLYSVAASGQLSVWSSDNNHLTFPGSTSPTAGAIAEYMNVSYNGVARRIAMYATA